LGGTANDIATSSMVFTCTFFVHTYKECKESILYIRKPCILCRCYNNKSIQMPSTTDNQEFYNSRQWVILRNAFMAKHVLCLHCKEKGIITPSVICDHIEEIDDNWDRRLDKTNLQALCIPCHNTKTAQAAKKRRSAGTLSPSDMIKWILNNR